MVWAPVKIVCYFADRALAMHVALTKCLISYPKILVRSSKRCDVGFAISSFLMRAVHIKGHLPVVIFDLAASP